MASQEYLEKLKDPRWQKKRLEVFERDDWACKSCHSKEKTLHVHHIFYQANNEPWDYPLFALMTLCLDCHECEHEAKKESASKLVWFLAKRGILPSIFNECVSLILDDTYHSDHDLNYEDLKAVFGSMRKNLEEIQAKKIEAKKNNGSN